MPPTLMVRVPVHFLTFMLSFAVLSTTEYKCVVFYRRSGDIIEIQEGLPTDVEAEACSPGFMNQDQLPFTSLLSKYEYFLGQHNHIFSLNSDA